MISIQKFKSIGAVPVLLIAAPLLEAQATTAIDANQPRPLWSAIDQLETAIPGVAINYEDPPYENTADVEDSATVQQQSAGRHFIVPRGGDVSAQITVPSTPAYLVADVVQDLDLLLTSYRQNALPGDFEVEQANGAFYVTPTSILGANGSPREVTSVMRTLITIPTAQRSVPDTLDAIFAAISSATGLRCGVVSSPFRPTDQVTFGASNEPARDALAKLFALAATVPVSYRVVFLPKPDPKRVFDYVANIHFAGYDPSQAPPGSGNVGQTPAAVTPPQAAGPGPYFTPVKH